MNQTISQYIGQEYFYNLHKNTITFNGLYGVFHDIIPDHNSSVTYIWFFDWTTLFVTSDKYKQ